MSDSYDVVVVGSGIAGSTTAMVLSRAGLKVLVVEHKNHPRFAIGESTIPTTSLLLYYLARTYDIPEFKDIAHYLGLRTNDLVAWPKQGFWYGLHREGKPVEKRHELFLETLLLPNGPDVHMLRADVDGFLVSRLGNYGIDYWDFTAVVGFEADDRGVDLDLDRKEGGRRRVRARLVIDASGHASFFANKFNLRDDPPRLHTNTRTIFGHFEGLPDLDEVLGGTNEVFRFRRTAGTMHHCFPGGWVWVIPFCSGVTSVGFVLNRDAYPIDPNKSAEAEWAEFLDRYPTMKAHLGPLKPIRPFVKADRIQFTSKTIIGKGFILTPHASGFIDPLFSSGILLTLRFVARIAYWAKKAKEKDDFDTEQFRHIERAFMREIQQVDRIVSGFQGSFRHPAIFRQFWRTWVLGTMAQLGLGIMTGTPEETEGPTMLYGAGLPGWPEDLQRLHAMVFDRETDPLVTAGRMKEILDGWHQRICPIINTHGDWEVESDRAMDAYGRSSTRHATGWFKALAETAGIDPQRALTNAGEWFARSGAEVVAQRQQYEASKVGDGKFADAYERILANQNPDNFDYFTHIFPDTAR